MSVIAAALIIGGLILTIAWWFLDGIGGPERRQRPQADPPTRQAHPNHQPWQPRQQSKEDLATQQQRCNEVKSECLQAARLMKDAHESPGSVEQLRSALDSLVAVHDQNASDGALGVIATTELCNAILEAQALEVLDAMQRHSDTDIAERSTKLFEALIPRIWSL